VNICGIVLITDLVCSSKYKRKNLLGGRKKMVPFEHQLKMGQSILRKSGNAYEKGTSTDTFQLSKGKKINISLPRKRRRTLAVRAL